MCGRGRCTLRVDDISRACHRNHASPRTLHMDRYRPSYNVSPGNHLPVVRREEGSNADADADADAVVLHCMKWGLIPTFTKKAEKPDHYKMFNARSESICEKASFRRLVPKNRCLVAVEGFYEWKKDGQKKQPYYIHFKDGRPLVFAALYDAWENSEGEILYTFTILTTSSSSALQWLHDRMPVILGDKVSTDTWLNGSSSSKFDNMLKPYEDADLVWYPVTPGMGKPSFDGPECIKEIKLKIEGSNPITKFFSTKAIKKEESSYLEEENSCAQSIKTDPPKSFKKELETEDNTAFSPFTKKGDQDARSNPISRFFSAEGIKEEQESNFEEKNSSAESFKTHPPKSFKKEPDTEDNKALLFFTGKGEQDSTSSVVHSQDGPAKCQLKRDYDELKGDSEQTTNETDKLCSTPARKKGNLKGGGDKQPTLFSYFGKS
ncbi:abasic site processing protein HMCES [Fagus crenata]